MFKHAELVENEVSHKDFLKSLGDVLDTTFNTDDKEKFEKAMFNLSTDSLSSIHPNYPTFFFFENIDGYDYMVHGDTAYRAKNYWNYSYVQEAANEDLGVCELFVLLYAPFWDVDDDWWSVCSWYGLGDYTQAASFGDVDVAIWVDYKYEKSIPMSDRKYSGFYSDGNPISETSESTIFETYAEAQSVVESLIKSPYLLAPSEIARPTYIITN